MKSFALSAINAALFASNVVAFPHMAMDSLTAPLAADVAYRKLLERQSGSPPQGLGALPLVPPPFNAASQRINTTGAHAVCSEDKILQNHMADILGSSSHQVQVTHEASAQA